MKERLVGGRGREKDMGRREGEGGKAYTSSVLRMLETRLPAAWTISSQTLW